MRADVLDIKVVYQQRHVDVDIAAVPRLFLPRTGPFELVDYDRVFAADPDDDIFALRGVDRGGCVVVVRPDQYVAAVLPLDATDELAAFFAAAPARLERSVPREPGGHLVVEVGEEPGHPVGELAHAVAGEQDRLVVADVVRQRGHLVEVHGPDVRPRNSSISPYEDSSPAP